MSNLIKKIKEDYEESRQLLLFHLPMTEIDIIWQEQNNTKRTLSNVRRGAFARIGDLAKKFMDLRQENEDLKHQNYIIRQCMDMFRQEIDTIKKDLHKD